MLQKFSPLKQLTNPAAGAPLVMQRGLGFLIGEAATNASQATRSTSDIASGVSIGATAGSIFPGVGTVIGAAVGAVVGAIGSLFGPAKLGQAALTWNDMTQHGYLFSQRGQAFDERYIGEAYKGAMDEGTNVWPGCGNPGYTNPDCFYSKLASVIAQGYLSGKVPLSASTSQVYTTVVVPWLASGAGGLFNYANALAEQKQQGTAMSQQELLIQAAVDRYIGGLPITRANMPAYAAYASQYARWSTPSITTALASLLHPTGTTGAAPVTASKALPALPSGQAYNYAGQAVALPAGYTAKAMNPYTPSVLYAVDAQGYILGSPNDVAWAGSAKSGPPPLGSGQGYNYDGQPSSVPSGYSIQTRNNLPYVVDYMGYILGSPNDQALVAKTQSANPAPTAGSGALSPGYGFNYAGLQVPIPAGYTLNSAGYIVDSQGYIFGSANDDALTQNANVAQTSGGSVPIVSQNYAPTPSGTPSTTAGPTTAPVSTGSNDTILFLGVGLAALYFLTRKPSKS